MAQLHRRVSQLPYRHLILALIAALVASPASAQEEAASALEVADGSDASVARLDRWLTELGSTDATVREAAYASLTTMDADMLPAIRHHLEGAHRGRPERRWAIDILNRFRRLGPRESEDAPPDVAEGARLELARSHRSREREWVREMAEVPVLWRALDRMESVEAQRTVFPLIAIDRGLWMPEARNWVRARGPRLMATTIYARRAEQPQTRRWARWAMEELGTEDPGRTIQELEVDLLPEVLRAYATLHVQSAMRVIVSHVDHPRRDVRSAARWAMSQYGGNAIWILRTAHRNELGELPPSEWAWERVADAIYEHVDAERMAPVREALDDGIEARARGDLGAMQTQFDTVLAQVAEVENPAPLAEGYAELAADAQGRGELVEARTGLRRALRLWPDGPPAAQWRADLMFVDAEIARSNGVLDADAYAALAGTDPNHPAAAILAEEPETRAPEQDDRTLWALIAAVALALLGMGLLWRPRDERQAEQTLDTDLGEAITLEPTFDGPLPDALEGDITLAD